MSMVKLDNNMGGMKKLKTIGAGRRWELKDPRVELDGGDRIW